MTTSGTPVKNGSTVTEEELAIKAIPPDHEIEDEFVKKIRLSVEIHLAEPSFTVEKLSKLHFMSHSQLHRKLDALTGCSPNKFIRIIRLKKKRGN